MSPRVRATTSASRPGVPTITVAPCATSRATSSAGSLANQCARVISLGLYPLMLGLASVDANALRLLFGRAAVPGLNARSLRIAPGKYW